LPVLGGHKRAAILNFDVSLNLNLNGSASGGGDSGGIGRVLLRVGASVDWDTAILSEGNVETAIIPAAGEEDDSKGEADNQEQVENTKPDEGRGDTDNVAAIRQTPGNGINEPEEVGVAREHGVVPADADAGSAPHAVLEGRKSQEHVGENTKGEEAPLVVAAGVGGDEVGDDPDPGEEDVEEDGGPGDAGENTEGDDDGREGDNPEDILWPEDLTVDTVGSAVCLGDEIPAEIRGHAEVGDEADEGSDDEEVVEEALTGSGAELVGEESEESHTKDGGDGVKPVGTAIAQVLRTSGRVSAQGIVASVEDSHCCGHLSVFLSG